MIKRAAASTLKALARSFPIIAVTGPRQSGKTTLVQSFVSLKTYMCRWKNLINVTMLPMILDAF